jgi:Family of unknown function (DUF5681)
LSGSGADAGGATRGRFRKGQSGNPGGRPRKQPVASTSAFDIVVGKTLTVTRNGVPREVTMEEALQHRTYQDAIAGKRMAQRQVLKWIEKREAWLEKQRHKNRTPAFNTVHLHDADNADDAMLLLGIVVENPDRKGLDWKERQLLFEPWAVQMALDRRSGRTVLEQKDIETITRCTRRPDSLRWPRRRPV